MSIATICLHTHSTHRVITTNTKQSIVISVYYPPLSLTLYIYIFTPFHLNSQRLNASSSPA